MKFFMKVDLSGEGEKVYGFYAPGQGYFRNVTMKLYTNMTTAMHIQMGKFHSERQISYTSGVISAAPGMVGPDTFAWYLFDAEREGSDEVFNHKKHFNGPLYVKKGDLIKVQLNPSGSVTAHLIIEGEFVLYKNSEFEVSYKFDTINPASSYSAQYIIPEYLDDAIMKVQGYLQTAGEVSGILRIAHLNRDQHVDVSNLSSMVGGFSGSFGDFGSAQMWVLNQTISSASGGFGRIDSVGMFDRRVVAGDRFAMDVDTLYSTFSSGDLDMVITLKGKVGYSRRAWKTNFYSGTMIIDWDTEVQGGLLQ